MYKRLTIYTDGASRGNPGASAAGIHIIDDAQQIVADLGFALGITTNNVAEYQAVLHAIAWLLAQRGLLANDIHIRFCLDSLLVVSQVSGSNQVRASHLQALLEEVKKALSQLPGIHTFEYISRSQNKDADRLANDVLDQM